MPKTNAPLGTHHCPRAWRRRCIITRIRIRRRDRQTKLLAPHKPQVRQEQLLRHPQRRQMPAAWNPIRLCHVEPRALVVVIALVRVTLAHKRNPDQVAELLRLAIVGRDLAACRTRLRDATRPFSDRNDYTRAWLTRFRHTMRRSHVAPCRERQLESALLASIQLCGHRRESAVRPE